VYVAWRIRVDLYPGPPPEIDGISVGECVTVLYSPEEILVSAQEASGC
jgi:hypothetical protein